jgi:hypothetical protein
MRTTLEAYTVYVDAAATFNRLAVRLKNGEVTMAEAEKKAKAKVEELAEKLGS